MQYLQDNPTTLANWRTPPHNRWAFSHVNEIVPSATIYGDFVPMASALQALSLAFHHAGQDYTLDNWLTRTYTDGIVITKAGKIVFERYFGETNARTPHIAMSVSKSILGLLFGALDVDLSSTIDAILPEFRHSAYQGISIADALNMQSGVVFNENASNNAMLAYRRAQGWNPNPTLDPPDLRTFLVNMRANSGQTGKVFDYISPNSDVLGLVAERIGGMPYAQLLSKIIWQPIGAQHGYITVDRLGVPRSAGGLCACVQDLARIGNLMIDGAWAGKQVIPQHHIHAIWQGIDDNQKLHAWQDGSFYALFGKQKTAYTHQWYVQASNDQHPQPMAFAWGMFGQHIYVCGDVVIAKCSSLPHAITYSTHRVNYLGAMQLMRALL